MGLFFSYPAICPIYPESDDENETCEYICSPILSAVIHDDNVIFEEETQPHQPEDQDQEKARKRANTWVNTS